MTMTSPALRRQAGPTPDHLAQRYAQVRALSCALVAPLSDADATVQSMADGKTYDSMSALRRTYRADGNPQGVEYTEVGDAVRTGPVTPKVTKEECATLLDKYEAAVSRGELPAE